MAEQSGLAIDILQCQNFFGWTLGWAAPDAPECAISLHNADTQESVRIVQGVNLMVQHCARVRLSTQMCPS